MTKYKINTSLVYILFLILLLSSVALFNNYLISNSDIGTNTRVRENTNHILIIASYIMIILSIGISLYGCSILHAFIKKFDGFNSSYIFIIIPVIAFIIILLVNESLSLDTNLIIYYALPSISAVIYNTIMKIILVKKKKHD